MSSSDRIGIELNSSIIRGVRIGRRPKTVEIPVEKDREREAFQNAIDQLGADASIRLVMRGLGVSTTRILDHPPDEIGSITEHIPIPERDATWHVIPLPGDRSLLLASQRIRLEECLDEWGVTPSSPISPDAVGLTLAALIALEPELEPTRDLVWIDFGRILQMHREAGRIIDARAVSTIPTGAILCGPGAWEAAQSSPTSTVFRPGGFDSAYTLAWGAAQWGGESVPDLPNLEPRDRREWRKRAANERSAHRRALAASLTLLLTSAAAYGFAWSDRASAFNERHSAITSRNDAEASVLATAAAVSAHSSGITSSNSASFVVARLIETASHHSESIYLTELTTQVPAEKFSTLASPRPEHRLRGRSRTLDAVEALRSDLANVGFDAVVEEATEIARPTFPVDFQVRVK